METKYTEFIERYFDGLLSAEEMKDFDRLKSNDEEFLKELELFKKANQAVRLSTIISLKSDIKQIHKDMEEVKKPRIISLIRIGVAASILLVVGIGFYAQSYSNRNLYNEAFSPVGDYITNMDDEFTDMEKAMELYDRNQFEKAKLLFTQVYDSTGDQVALFYVGHCEYQAGNMQKAIQDLSKVSNSYESEAQWYIALAYLKINDVDRSINMLDNIIDGNQDEKFTVKARQLKEKLSSPLRKLVF